MNYPKRVHVVEVAPRDGLQNERAVTIENKLALIEALVDAGVTTIECGSFVSAKHVPQMADTAAVFQKLKRKPGVTYVALVPNQRGLEAAMACGVEEIALFASASESFSQSNIQCSIAESLRRLGEVAHHATTAGMRLRGYVSCVLGCPFEGDVALSAVARVAKELLAMGCYEISLGDTIGVGTPLQTLAMLERVAEDTTIDRLAVHFHDTWGQALANVLIAVQAGITSIDASVAGLGGCLYAPGATGNLATEDLIYLLNGMGIETGIDLEKLAAAGRLISNALHCEPTSRAAAAIASKRPA